MGSPLVSEDDVFERLKETANPGLQKEREKYVQERVKARFERAQARLGQTVQENSTLPVYIRSVQIDGAKVTRRGFLERLIAPALSAEKQQSYTLQSLMEELNRTTSKLQRFGKHKILAETNAANSTQDIFRPGVSIHLDGGKKGSPGQPTPLDVIFNVRERGRITAKTGTDLSSHDVTGYLNGIVRNTFGGGETFSVTATTGARTRSSFEANLQVPIYSNIDCIASASAFSSVKSHAYYASFEEILRGGRLGFSYTAQETRDYYDVNYTAVWRQISNLSKDASPSVRHDAGDSVKSSVRFSFTRDWRDHPFFPTRGYKANYSSEFAGTILGGDVDFWKSEFVGHAAMTFLPRRSTTSSPELAKSASYWESIALNFSLRGGLLYPLVPGKLSRINDRFFLGGPNDVRSFRENGIGPRDGNDSIGGDLYVAGGVSLFLPLPKLGPEKPFRLHTFVNAGKVVTLQQHFYAKSHGNVVNAVGAAVKELGDGLPSMTAGVGLIYAHPVARFELNFGVPFVMRVGEKARKGFQFGVGLEFL